MAKKGFIFFSVLFVLMGHVGAQKKEAVQDYINTWRETAIAEMLRTGVPAAITLAQGIHESGAGLSQLVQESNNHFGIKCKSNWTGETVKHDDDAKQECFRKYPSAAESFRDHSDFLKAGQRYAFLFTYNPEDYKAWAKGLKQAGYATNPKYPEVLIKLIEDYNLQEYTLIALGKLPDTQSEQQPVFTAQTEAGEKVVPPAEDNNYRDRPVPAVTPAYPDYVFKINETKVVFVKKGISYLSIAQQYSVDLGNLFKFNDMEPAEATAYDQLVYLQPKRKTGDHDHHEVKPGESLLDIAQTEAIRMESLLEYNWLKPGQVPAVGEKLSLKKKSDNMPKLALKDNYSILNNTHR